MTQISPSSTASTQSMICCGSDDADLVPVFPVVPLIQRILAQSQRRVLDGPAGEKVVCGQVRSGLVWGFSCQAVVLGCAESFLFGAGKAVFRPVACNQVPGARGRGQGTETLAELGGLPRSVACVSQRLDA